jgi:hypothetical protein
VLPTATRVGAAARQGPGRLRRDVVTVLCGVVVAVAAVVRIAFAANQSYWTDELFSVNQTAGGFGQVLDVGRTEVHTPLYASLLWLWQHVGGSSTLWTRLLSVIIGLVTILAAQLGLRGSGISLTARRLAVAVTAACGFAIVYAQDDRPYGLVLLGATGFTAVTVARLVALGHGETRGLRGWLTWVAWGLLTATAHLLGAAFVGVVTLALAGADWRAERLRGVLRTVGLAVVALLPQLAWLVAGVGRSGFASGTSWILAPKISDVWTLLKTVLAAGGLTPRADGFAWTSARGVVAVLVVLAGAALFARRGRRAAAPEAATPDAAKPPAARRADRRRGAAPDDARLDLRMGAVLVGIAAATILGTYAIAQVVHVWTLRNMIVVVPPLTWGVAWVAAALPATRTARRAVAVTVLVATLLSLAGVAHDLSRPYKTDWRALIHYLERVRTEDPTATFSVFGGNPSGAFTAADQDRSDPRRLWFDQHIDHHPRNVSAIAGLRRIPGRQVVYFYPGIGRPKAPTVQRSILRQLHDPTCRPVPIYGLVVVSCP